MPQHLIARWLIGLLSPLLTLGAAAAMPADPQPTDLSTSGTDGYHTYQGQKHPCEKIIFCRLALDWLTGGGEVVFPQG